MYYAILIVPWFATFAMTVQLGLWSNAILLAQITFSGIIAFGFYQPLATVLDEATGGGLTYFWDFIAIWILYIGSMLILKILDQWLSKKRMRFQQQVDQYGGPLVGLVAGWVMTGIVMASIHTAPLSPDTVKRTKDDVQNTSSLLAPDLAWLRLMESVSASGALGAGNNTFSTSDYIVLYSARRTEFAKAEGFQVKRSGAR